jgi:heme A synthase
MQAFFLGMWLATLKLPRPIRYALILCALGFVLAVTFYTLYVILTLPERVTGHVQPHHLY